MTRPRFLLSACAALGLVLVGALLVTPVQTQPQAPVQSLRAYGATGSLDSIDDTVVLPTGGLNSMKIQTLDSYSGTWELQCSVDGSTYDEDDELNLAKIGSSAAAVQSVTDEVGIWDVNVAGCAVVRAYATSWSSGDVSMRLFATTSGGGTGGGGGGGVGGGGDASLAEQETQTAHLAAIEIATEAIKTAAEILDDIVGGDGVNISQIGGATPVAAVCDDPSKITTVNVNETAATGNTQALALDGTDLIYVCGFELITGGASVVQIIYGTGSACATGETDVRTYDFNADGDGIVVNGGGSPIFVIPAGNALCTERGSSVTLTGGFSVVQQVAP